MTIYLLEFLYALALSTQKLLKRSEPRYYPFIVMQALLLGVINSIIRVVLAVSPEAIVSRLTETRVWRGGDWAWIAALAITMVLVWFFFDRRRALIDGRFGWLAPCTSNKQRFLISFPCFGVGAALVVMSTVSPLLTICGFLAFSIIGSVIVRKMIAPNDAAS